MPLDVHVQSVLCKVSTGLSRELRGESNEWRSELNGKGERASSLLAQSPLLLLVRHLRGCFYHLPLPIPLSQAVFCPVFSCVSQWSPCGPCPAPLEPAVRAVGSGAALAPLTEAAPAGPVPGHLCLAQKKDNKLVNEEAITVNCK